MSYIYESKMESQHLASVVDVYDLAATIGKDFEATIDIYGVEAVSCLMPKVIRSLEMLENMALWAERENIELEESQCTIQRLQRDKMEKAQQKLEYEKELEQYEDKWRSETQDLLDVISKLQSENRRMGAALQERDKTPSPTDSTREEEIKLMTKMKATIDKQREQMRSAKKDLEQKQIDTEAMQAQVERLAKLNVELRRKHSVTSRQAKSLIEEKTTLQAQLQGKEQEISKIRDGMGVEESPSSPISPTRLTQEIEEQLQQDGKLLIDLKDPNRPRFTLSELREVILERNELKTKLIEVEEELSQYKPKESEETSESDELPVYGPINKEPYSKLYPDGKPGESGVRRLKYGKERKWRFRRKESTGPGLLCGFNNLFNRSNSPKKSEPVSIKRSSIRAEKTDKTDSKSEVLDRRRMSLPVVASSRKSRSPSTIYQHFPGSNLPI